MENGSTRALVGWKRRNAGHGVALTLQLIRDADDFRDRNFETLNIVVNDRQLRSLARDLARIVKERGLDLQAPRPWWRFGRG